MQVLQFIFFTLGIIVFCVYLYKSSKEKSNPKPEPVKELEPGYPSDKWYYGPVPTEEENRNFSTWVTQFFKEFPQSGLKEHYPKEANLAKALVTIDKLNLQLQRGEIDEIDYAIEYEKASELIDISEDIV